ncbi:hypothetical protein ACROYT_G020286 [Oculina patagonica]
MASFTLVLTGVSTPILLCNVIGNVLVIVVIKKNKKLHNANTFLLANLAASDVAFAILSFVIFRLPQQSGSIWINSFGEFIFHALASIFMLVALAVERYFAILKPFVHLTRAVKSLMWKVLLAIWILAGVLSAPGYPIAALRRAYAKENATMNVTDGEPVWLETLSTVYIFVVFAFGLILPSVVMIFCYSRVIYHVWLKTEANRATNLALLRSRRKLTKLFIIVTVIFIVTWTPTFGTLIKTQFLKSENSWKFELSSMLLALLGSAANPVIYSFRCPRFRQEVVKLLNFLGK